MMNVNGPGYELGCGGRGSTNSWWMVVDGSGGC